MFVLLLLLQIFAGLVLYFNGCTDGISAHHLAKMVQQHGGNSTPQLSVKKVSYIIATNLNGSKTQQALQRSRKVVHPDWYGIELSL
jgi:NAD-dependent DNA ligase